MLQHFGKVIITACFAFASLNSPANTQAKDLSHPDVVGVIQDIEITPDGGKVMVYDFWFPFDQTTKIDICSNDAKKEDLVGQEGSKTNLYVRSKEQKDTRLTHIFVLCE